MHLVTAIVRPHVVEELRAALRREGALSMTVTEVAGYGRQGGRHETYRGAEYDLLEVPKVKVEVVVDTFDADRIVAVVRGAAWTGGAGDGKVRVTEVEDVVRIRTRERGPDAL